MSEPPHEEPTDADFMAAHIAALEAENRGLHIEAREQVALIHDEQARVAALESALKYCQDDKEVMRNVIDVLEADKAVLEQIKQRLLSAATAEVNDTGMGYTERIVTIVEDLLSEWEITAAHEHILEETGGQTE